jgi:hypothetical protein
MYKSLLALLFFVFVVGCASTPVPKPLANNWEVTVIIPDAKQPLVWLTGNPHPLTRGSVYDGWKVSSIGYDYVIVNKRGTEQKVFLSEKGKEWRSPNQPKK